MKSTPIAHSKSAALARVLDTVPRGYVRYLTGQVAETKLGHLAEKFHDKYGIAENPGRRLQRKKNGTANCLWAVYRPAGAQLADWLLLATAGAGLESEKMQDIHGKPRLVWLGYELSRYSDHGKDVCTWRRPKQLMREAYALIADYAHKHRFDQVQCYLDILAGQPGFHGVRKQTMELRQFAVRLGYAGPMAPLPYIRKVPHGTPLVLRTD